jgi:hypothetical protein
MAAMQTTDPAIAYHPLSFGDPNGRLFWRDGQLFRGIKGKNVSFYRNLINFEPIRSLMNRGVLVPTSEVDFRVADYSLILKHKTYPRITYAYEWAFDALKDAALLTLSIQQELSENGLMLKDAHPWNIVFDGSRPVFVDFCSIVPVNDDVSWPAYEEFCRFFLNPLRLMAAGHGRAARWLLRDEDDGVYNHELSAIFGGVGSSPRNFKAWVEPVRHMAQIYLSTETRRSLKRLIKRTVTQSPSNVLRSARRQIEQLKLPVATSEWSNYYDNFFPPLSPSPDWTQKHHVVNDVLQRIKPCSILDIACNKGWYSELATSLGCEAVAFDRDEICINTLYGDAKRAGLDIHPLVMNVLNPSGGDGLNREWFPPATERLKCEMVFAFALAHHLAFKRRLSFEKIVSAFDSFSSKYLLVEFVPKEDHYVSAWWTEEFEWYTLDNFESALRSKFREVTVYPSYPSPRCLLLCEK